MYGYNYNGLLVYTRITIEAGKYGATSQLYKCLTIEQAERERYSLRGMPSAEPVLASR